MEFGKILTIMLITFLIVGVGLFVWNESNQSLLSYQRYLSYSLTKTKLSYDYSCDQQVYSLNIVLTNDGDKLVNDLSASVTNALCVGAIPQMPDSLAPSQQLAVDIYTTGVNGTITVTGNNTVLLVQF
ncbi:MAG: hypothetical protein ABSE82_07725 [Nitrososphaerales archaeon]|jgi:hypothetical protein